MPGCLCDSAAGHGEDDDPGAVGADVAADGEIAGAQGDANIAVPQCGGDTGAADGKVIRFIDPDVAAGGVGGGELADGGFESICGTDAGDGGDGDSAGDCAVGDDVDVGKASVKHCASGGVDDDGVRCGVAGLQVGDGDIAVGVEGDQAGCGDGGGAVCLSDDASGCALPCVVVDSSRACCGDVTCGILNDVIAGIQSDVAIAI